MIVDLRGWTSRRGLLATVSLALAVASASPASAAPAAVAVGTSDGPVPFVSTAECTLSPGVTTDLVTATYVVRGSAESSGPAISTRVGCVVYDPWGERIGGCAGALPGPFAVCAGTAIGLLHLDTELCAEVESRYMTGAVGGSRPCP